jgi:competence protein ComEC
LKRKKINILWLALIAIASIFSFIRFPDVFNDDLTLYAFDVGQADSFLFRFPGGKTALVDAGARETGGELVSKLRRLGVSKIDILVATHPHEDHIGGMRDVINAFEIGKVWDSGFNYGSSVQKATLEALKEKKIRFGRPRHGFTEKIGDASIEVIAPKRPISGTTSDANNNSLVLRVSYGDVSFLMMGDIEEAGRAAAAPFPRSTALKVSHHGSRNGTDEKLMNEVKPQIAILSYGRRNQYGHPHKEVTKLLDDYGVKSYATANGDIILKTDGKTLTIEQRETL